jgi:hypothetical protein
LALYLLDCDGDINVWGKNTNKLDKEKYKME